MKILELRAENFKRLKVVEIRPDGNLVQVTGRNGAGKTSVLDAIWVALAGMSVAPPRPVRKGCEVATIRLDLGELKIVRTFTAREDGEVTTNLKVENADGTKLPSPQSVLNAIAGRLTFDPLAFVRMPDGDQIDALKGFVPGVDFVLIEAANRGDFEERTVLNRRAKDLRAQAAGIKLPAGPVPTRVDIAGLEKTLGDAADHNSLLERRKAKRDSAVSAIEGHRSAALRLRQEAGQHAADADELQAQLDGAEALPAPIDTEEVRAQLAAGREANQTLDLAEQRRKIELVADEAEQNAKALTKAMDDREAAKEAAIQAAEMPIKGLGFGDGFVTLNGQPFSQASDAEQLRASIAICAAMSPELRIARVRDGSLLDDNGIAALGRFAEEHDLQVWIERVDSSGKVGFVLEDGHLKGDEPEEAV